MGYKSSLMCLFPCIVNAWPAVNEYEADEMSYLESYALEGACMIPDMVSKIISFVNIFCLLLRSVSAVDGY